MNHVKFILPIPQLTIPTCSYLHFAMCDLTTSGPPLSPCHKIISVQSFPLCGHILNFQPLPTFHKNITKSMILHYLFQMRPIVLILIGFRFSRDVKGLRVGYVGGYV
jgi:hypothetical protein